MRILCNRFAADLSRPETVRSLLAAGCDFYDMDRRELLIPDVSIDDDEGHVLRGVMVAGFDPYHFAEVGMWDALDEPVQYALGGIPAPGTGAPSRMGFMEAEEAAEWISRAPSVFRNPEDGFRRLD